MTPLRLGVNIDHVATIRNARGYAHPDPVHAALVAIKAGADGITAHLREDRRHISDDDIERLLQHISAPLNLECAPTHEMIDIALRHRPAAVCLVPEKREERTTEGGLDSIAEADHLKGFIHHLKQASIRVSLFVDPKEEQIIMAKQLGADIVELHTGVFCHHTGHDQQNALTALRHSAALAIRLGLECHAGHGITFDTVSPIAAILEVSELNIGHFLIGEAIFMGLEHSIQKMRTLMHHARL
jgi:pyridoxine 5-phosphate synthase